MSQLLKPIDQWTADDLEQFVRERAEESLVLEFKRELNLGNNSGKKEAAKDVCALANTSGGWIIYGIDEDRAPDSAPVASAVVPFDAGASASQLENIVLSAISPAPNVRIRRIDCDTGACIVVRVEPSSTCVHQVVAYGDYRFYRRTDIVSTVDSQSALLSAQYHQTNVCCISGAFGLAHWLLLQVAYPDCLI